MGLPSNAEYDLGFHPNLVPLRSVSEYQSFLYHLSQG